MEGGKQALMQDWSKGTDNGAGEVYTIDKDGTKRFWYGIS